MKLKTSYGMLVAFLLLGAGQPAFAEAPSLSSAEDNVAYAVGAICAPFALDEMEMNQLPIGKGLVQPDGHDGLARPNPTGVRVGVAGFVHVTFSRTAGGTRACDVEARGADPQALRRVALDALAQRPESFAPTRSKYLPGRFATEDMLCAGMGSAQPKAAVILSSPAPAEQDKIALLFTLTNGGARSASCDQDGVRLNFRTLVP